MINGYYHREMKYHGKQIMIDACHLESGRIEVMTMYKGGVEIESQVVDTVEEAERIFNDMRFRYENQEEAALKGRYAKLRDDLIKAIEAGKAADNGEDGGTCNFDAPSIGGRWVISKVRQAAKEAGTSVFRWKLCGGSRYVFGVPTGGQGNRRCRVSEAMCEALKTAGYDVIEYSSMD